jgi:polar amino acid transport system substrate-binding protein
LIAKLVPAGGARPGCESRLNPCSASNFWKDQIVSELASELAPTGVLRVGINMGNGLLVTGKTPSGDPQGVAPDMAAEIAKRLGVPVAYVKYERPSQLADAGGSNVWDIGLIGAEPARAEKIAFTPAYCEIEATYLVPAGSPFKSVADVDRAGARIAVRRGAAYDLWLTRNLKHATLLRSDSADGPLNQFVSDKLDALASLRQGLLQDVKKVPGGKILPDNYTTIQQAIGTAKGNTAGAAFLRDFVAEAKKSGLVARLIEKHHVVGLSVAP